MQNLVDDISRMKAGRQFTKYIDYIRFYRYRNLEKKTKIDFDFPLTAFIGKNGSGKSSTLQALFGSPANRSVGNFWFSTELDPIKDRDDAGDGHHLIYAYTKESGEQVEVIKARIYTKTQHNDYWEPSRPIKKYGMELLSRGQRHDLLEMNVEYIDFRSILSAFDKYFYYKQPENLKSKTKQEYLRKRTILLKNIFERNNVLKIKSKEQNKLPVPLTNEELKQISRILGKNYVGGTVIEHRLFGGDMGTSVIYQTRNFNYSEAFAGSGEMAVVELVHRVLRAPNHSLVLLDEPDVSIHPGAQEQLKIFLLEQIKDKKLQIVMSTHSPALVRGLPPSAIKVFRELPDGTMRVEDDHTPDEAFFFVGELAARKKRICVEDKLAKEVVDKVLQSMGEEVASTIEVRYFPGGAEWLMQEIAFHSRELPSNIFVILDGDKQPEETIDPENLTIAEQNKNALEGKIHSLTRCQVNFGTDSRNEQNAIDARVNYLRFFRDNVRFFDFNSPEEALWNDETARTYLTPGRAIAEIDEIMTEINRAQNAKKKFKLLAENVDLGDSSSDIFATQRLFVGPWIREQGVGFEHLKNLIEEVRAANLT